MRRESKRTSATPIPGRNPTDRTSRITGGRSRPSDRRGSAGPSQREAHVTAASGRRASVVHPKIFAARASLKTDPSVEEDERSVSLSVAASLPELEVDGRPQKPSTIHSWTERGCRGVMLESWRIGGVKVTSRASVARFLKQLNERADAPAGAASRDRQLQHRAAERALDMAGI